MMQVVSLCALFLLKKQSILDNRKSYLFHKPDQLLQAQTEIKILV